MLVEAAWNASESHFQNVIRRFAGATGCPVDEAESEGLVLWMRLYRQHAPITHDELLNLCSSLSFDLSDWWRQMTGKRRKHVLKQVAAPSPGETMAASGTRPDAMAWRFDLSADGAEVLRLMLDPPDVVTARVDVMGKSVKNVRPAIRYYLGNHGWNTARVNEAFREIAERMAE